MFELHFIEQLPPGYQHPRLRVEMEMEDIGMHHMKCIAEKNLRIHQGWLLDSGFPPMWLWIDALAGATKDENGGQMDWFWNHYISDSFKKWADGPRGRKWMNRARLKLQEEKNMLPDGDY